MYCPLLECKGINDGEERMGMRGWGGEDGEEDK